LDEADEQIRVLEPELNNANCEISHLNSELAQSPTRKALDWVHNTKIELLEKEKEDPYICDMKNTAYVIASW
jgi:hypothetical protein